jgi:Raf kinase inhibitor-like YbhB/YbcL family protein
MQIRSPRFSHLGAIPAKYTCEGTDCSPPLEWDGIPDETVSLVLIVDDPDAPDPEHPEGTYTHWVLYNLPPDSEGLAEGASDGGLPMGAREGLNDRLKTEWCGPCPPIGTHRYFFRLYALDCSLPGLAQPPTKADVESAMSEHIIAAAELVGRYHKHARRGKAA